MLVEPFDPSESLSFCSFNNSAVLLSCPDLPKPTFCRFLTNNWPSKQICRKGPLLSEHPAIKGAFCPFYIETENTAVPNLHTTNIDTHIYSGGSSNELKGKNKCLNVMLMRHYSFKVQTQGSRFCICVSASTLLGSVSRCLYGCLPTYLNRNRNITPFFKFFTSHQPWRPSWEVYLQLQSAAPALANESPEVPVWLGHDVRKRGQHDRYLLEPNPAEQ